VRRREFITLLGGATAAWPLAARAQQQLLVGYLTVSSEAVGERFAGAFRRGMSEAGFMDGRNVILECRYADGQVDRLREFAEDFVRRGANVIAAMGGSRAALVAKTATATTPIVFTMGDADPVQVGVVGSLARPGGNVTGVSLLGGLLGAKRLALLRELVPSAATIGVLINPNNRDVAAEREELDAAIANGGQRALIIASGPSDDIEGTIGKFAQNQVDAIIVTADPIFTNRRTQITALVARYRIPAIYQWNLFVSAGGLMSYGTDLEDMYRQAGHYAGRILKGEKPGDLPVLQPTKFLLSLNLTAAKALGLQIPDKLLALADEVIE
jgi:ABC-type uncharacterized transport system substrate-binding protein